MDSAPDLFQLRSSCWDALNRSAFLLTIEVQLTIGVQLTMKPLTYIGLDLYQQLLYCSTGGEYDEHEDRLLGRLGQVGC